MPDNTTMSEKIQLLDWIKTNPSIAAAIILAAALIWMFLDQKEERAAWATERKSLQTTIDNLRQDQLNRETERRERSDFVIGILNSNKNDTTTKK